MTILSLDYSAGYMKHSSIPKEGDRTGHWTTDLNMSIGESSSATSNKAMAKRSGKRPGRKPSRIDERAKLERSRQSARECRARKKLRYQYLEELVLNREKAVFALRDELETCKQWCFQLERGGPVPESLMKMLTNENISARKAQMKQATGAQFQQQRLQQQLQFSSSSSTSSTSPEMSPASSHQQPSHQISVVQSQMVGKLLGGMPLSQQQQVQQQQSQHLLQQRQAASSAHLQRQIAFDHTDPKDFHPNQTPQLNNQAVISTAQANTQGYISAHKSSTSQQQQLILPHHQYQQSNVSNILRSQQGYSLPETKYVARASSSRPSLEPFLSRVKSEPPVKYETFVDMLQTFTNDGSDCSKLSPGCTVQEHGDAIRRRSVSNPDSMTLASRPRLQVTSAQDMPSPLQDFITSHSSSRSTNQQSGVGFGLFSGSVLGTNMHSSSMNILNPITIEDSSSPDETVNEQQLFQSSLNSQKRTLSAPFLSENPKRHMMDTSTVISTTTNMNYDPQTRLFNFTNVNCSDMTKTSDTSSLSSYGLIPSPSSSMRYSGLSNYTPSSSSTTSPAPLSSLSSVLEFSDPSATLETISEMSTAPTSGQARLQTNSFPTQSSSTNLNSFTSDLLPDWYSFLAELEDGAMSTVNSRPGASASHGTRKPHEQPLTNDTSFMNVPNIIDDILDSEDQLL